MTFVFYRGEVMATFGMTRYYLSPALDHLDRHDLVVLGASGDALRVIDPPLGLVEVVALVDAGELGEGEHALMTDRARPPVALRTVVQVRLACCVWLVVSSLAFVAC